MWIIKLEAVLETIYRKKQTTRRFGQNKREQLWISAEQLKLVSPKAVQSSSLSDVKRIGIFRFPDDPDPTLIIIQFFRGKPWRLTEFEEMAQIEAALRGMIDAERIGDGTLTRFTPFKLLWLGLLIGGLIAAAIFSSTVLGSSPNLPFGVCLLAIVVWQYLQRDRVEAMLTPSVLNWVWLMLGVVWTLAGLIELFE